MGLTSQSTGIGALDSGLKPNRSGSDAKVIALAGNPNVGKSTVFNQLTGLNQHTGNWPGKTVTNATGKCLHKNMEYLLVDLPGTYSLMANSEEEEVARDFICFGEPDATIIVADATCLERNLNLVLQTLEITSKVILCVNLMDEAKRKKIQIDLEKLAAALGIPVIGASARSGKGLAELMDKVSEAVTHPASYTPMQIVYEDAMEAAIRLLEPVVKELLTESLNSRWVSIRLLDGEESILQALKNHLGQDLLSFEDLAARVREAQALLEEAGIDREQLRDKLVSKLILTAAHISGSAITCQNDNYNQTDRNIDRILTSKRFGIPIMIGLLGAILWITITGANYPSRLLSDFLFWIEGYLKAFCSWAGAPSWAEGLFVMGIYRTLAWVVSVMLPPMAIFFPLFTLLEDLGYLPRVAFNLDKFFQKACAHGKQALTMCMGFGCNAAGIIGCRIIDSPRERLIAMITNNFVPCNGRFPTLIALITMFFVGVVPSPLQSVFSTLLLTAVLVLGILMTLMISKLLSKTILKGLPSSFTLELPPYRKPQIGRVIVRSVLDRTLFVLGRAVVIAVPAGILIWVMANIRVGNGSILAHCATFLDPFARWIGLDGYILMAFILGFPANEIVVPIIIMSYTATGNILELDNLEQLKELFLAHGWTWLTAICTMLFSLFHWPCGTTCLTIRKEAGGAKWTVLSFLIPTITGVLICFVLAGVTRLLGLV